MHGTIKPAEEEARERAYATPLEDFDVSEPELFRTDTFWPYFDRLRKEEPVHYCKDSMFGPYWSVTKYNDIMEIETNHAVFSSAASLGGITIRDVAAGPAARELHRHGSAAARPAAQDRRADVHADAPGRARDQHPQALGFVPGQPAPQRDLRLGGQGFGRAHHADARRAVRFPVGGAAQADALVRYRHHPARPRRPGGDRRGAAGRTDRMRAVLQDAVGRAHQAAAEERPVVDDGAQRGDAKHGLRQLPRQPGAADRRRQRHHAQHAVGLHLRAQPRIPTSTRSCARTLRCSTASCRK